MALVAERKKERKTRRRRERVPGKARKAKGGHRIVSYRCVLARHSTPTPVVCLFVCLSYLVLCRRDESAGACDALLTTEASLVHGG